MGKVTEASCAKESGESTSSVYRTWHQARDDADMDHDGDVKELESITPSADECFLGNIALFPVRIIAKLLE